MNQYELGLIHKHQVVFAYICIALHIYPTNHWLKSQPFKQQLSISLSRGQGGAVALSHSPGESRLTYAPFDSIDVAGTIRYTHVILYIVYSMYCT